MNKKIAIFIIDTLLSVSSVLSQTKIAVTIDDVPNVSLFAESGFQSKFQQKLDVLKIPVTVFVNEGLVHKNEHVEKNMALLDQWAKRSYVTLGNHTKDHLRYSSVGFERFIQDIENGEKLLQLTADKYGKAINYFRFPFNDLGENEHQHFKIDDYLQKNNYINTPFIVESSDYVFNYLYNYYRKTNEDEKAHKIAITYVDKTVELFQYFDAISKTVYHRNINQIYLCHDSRLNADYFDLLVKKLEESGFIFITLGEALEDPVYKQKTHYFGKYGISWFYRWMEDSTERKKMMRKEPDLTQIYNLYKALQNKG